MQGDVFVSEIRRLVSLGLRPFPVFVFKNPDGKREKIPACEWSAFHLRPPVPYEIQKWADDPLVGYFGIGIDTTGLVVVDMDQKDGRPDWQEYADGMDLESLMWTKTGGGGLHIFFRNDAGHRNATNIFRKDKGKGETCVDIRADGGYVVFGGSEVWSSDPRSSKPSAEGRYETHNEANVRDLPSLPEIFLSAMAGTKKNPKYTEIRSGESVKEGGRHDTAASLAFSMVNSVTVRTSKDLEASALAYWKVIDERFENHADPLERVKYQDCWDSAVNKRRANEGEGWPFEIRDIVKDKKFEVRREMEYKTDMAGWNLEIEKVVRMGELFVFHLVGGKSFELDVKDILSQTAFRTAYIDGTNMMLPSIKPKSYEKFLSSWNRLEVEDTGASVAEIIKDSLVFQAENVAVAETLGEALDDILMQSWARFGERLFFRVQALSLISPHLTRKGLSPARLMSALATIGAKRYEQSSFWYYDLA